MTTSSFDPQYLGPVIHPPLTASTRPADPRLSTRFLLPGLLLVGLCAAIASFMPFEFAGVVFLLGYIIIAATNPTAALCIMLGSAPFPIDVGGLPVKIATSDLCMVIACATLVFRWASVSGKIVYAPVYIPIAIYLGICFISTAVTGFAAEAITSVAQMIIYMVVATVFFSNMVKITEILPALYAQLATCCFLSFAMLAGGGYVFGIHKNNIGTSLCFATIIAFELWTRAGVRKAPRRLLTIALIICAFGLLLSISRGAILGALFGCAIILTLRGKFALMFKAAFAAIPLAALVYYILPDSQVSYATDFSTSTGSIRARLDSINFAFDQFTSSPIIGVGVGLRKMYDATNLVLAVLAETGVLGLGAFLAIFATLGHMVFVTARRLPKDNLMFSLLLIGAALQAGKFLHGLADHYWSRGILPVWVGAGFIVAAYAAVRRQPRGTLPR